MKLNDLTISCSAHTDNSLSLQRETAFFQKIILTKKSVKLKSGAWETTEKKMEILKKNLTAIAYMHSFIFISVEWMH